MLLFKLPARFLVLVLAFDAALAVRPGIKVDGSRRLSRLLQKFLASEDRRSEFQDTLNTSTDDRWQREMCDQCNGAFTNYFSTLQTATRPNLVAVGIMMLGAMLTWLMMDTAQLFFLPALFYWSKRLNLSSEMAAATLLAVGNGAPDMADAVAAAQLQDLPLGLSDLGGANLCCMSLGNCLCLLVAYMADPDSKSAVLQHPGHYLVLLAFYGSAIVLLAFSLQKATANFWHFCALTALYGAFLLYLAMRNHLEEAEDAHGMSRSGRRRNSSTDTAIEDAMACLSPPDSDSWPGSVAWALLLPFTLIRMVTIPPCDLRWDTPRRVFHTMCPTGLYLLCRLLGYIAAPGFNAGVATAVALAVTTVLIFLTGGTSSSAKTSGSPLPWFYNGMTLLALVSSMLWLSALSDEMTASLEAVCRFYKISRLRSGFTLLAWGNCAGDLVAAYSIALMGEFSLAFNGLVAGQFFNTAVGFSTALMTVTWRHPQITVFANGWPSDISHPLLACTVSTLLVVATQAAFSVVDLHVRSPLWGVVLAAVYGTFFIYMWRNTSADVPNQQAAEETIHRTDLIAQGFQDRELRYRGNIAAARDQLLDHAQEYSKLQAGLRRSMEDLALLRDDLEIVRHDFEKFQRNSQDDEDRDRGTLALLSGERKELERKLSELKDRGSHLDFESNMLRSRAEQAKDSSLKSAFCWVACRSGRGSPTKLLSNAFSQNCTTAASQNGMWMSS